MRAAPRPESVAVLAEARIEYRLQHLQKRLLYQPVLHRRYAQLAFPAIGLGNLHPPHRRGPVAAIEQLSPDVRPGGLQYTACLAPCVHRRRRCPCWL